MHRRGLGFLGGRGHLHGGVVDGLYQAAQLVDGVVDGVGDGAGEVLGHRRFHGQVTVRQVAELVQQTQNRRLVTLVLALQFVPAAGRLTVTLQHDQEEQQHGDGGAHRPQPQRREQAGGGLLELGVEVGGFLQQVLGVTEDGVRRAGHLEQFRGGLENLVHGLVNELVEQP